MKNRKSNSKVKIGLTDNIPIVYHLIVGPWVWIMHMYGKSVLLLLHVHINIEGKGESVDESFELAQIAIQSMGNVG